MSTFWVGNWPQRSDACLGRSGSAPLRRWVCRTHRSVAGAARGQQPTESSVGQPVRSCSPHRVGRQTGRADGARSGLGREGWGGCAAPHTSSRRSKRHATARRCARGFTGPERHRRSRAIGVADMGSAAAHAAQSPGGRTRQEDVAGCSRRRDSSSSRPDDDLFAFEHDLKVVGNGDG